MRVHADLVIENKMSVFTTTQYWTTRLTSIPVTFTWNNPKLSSSKGLFPYVLKPSRKKPKVEVWMVMWLVTGGKTHREYKRSLDQFKVAATSSPCETLLHCSTRKAKRTITKNKKAKQNKTITIRKKVMVTTSKWNTRTRKVYGCHSQRFLTFPWPFPDIFLTNVKFPWPTELTISQILLLRMDSTLPLQPSPHPFIYVFSKSRAMYMNW